MLFAITCDESVAAWRRCESAPYVARVSAEGTINCEISRITLVSFLSCTFRQVDLIGRREIMNLWELSALR
jgi:hypothetical protein